MSDVTRIAPGLLAIGVGCRSGASEDAVVGLVEKAIGRAHLDAGRQGRAALFTVAAKRSETGLAAAAVRLGMPLVFLPEEALKAASGGAVTHSERVVQLFGVPSLAECAALAGAGKGARLIVARMAGDGVTCAVAAQDEEGDGIVTVHFIGAGPGAPDLITLRGRDLIAASPVCLYAGSLIPPAILAHCPPGARIVDTAPMSLDEIIAECRAAHAAGQDVARLHSGDLSVWSAMGEQLRRLRDEGIPVTVTPGVPAFAAAAAALQAELTLPELGQSLVLTRTSGRASAMPERETLANFAATGATLAIHLSIHVLDKVVAELTPFYGADCPAAIVYRASWPDERIIRATLSTLPAEVAASPIERTALILVGPVIGASDFRESALYSVDYQRRFRGREGI